MSEEKKKKTKKKIKITKKKIILIVVAILIVIFAIFKLNGKKDNEVKTFDTKEIEKRQIVTSISSTGTVDTSTSKNVTSTLTGYEIASVNVVEGQHVNVGDVICTFDVSKLQQSLNDAKASLSATQTQNFYSIQNAQRSLTDAQNSKNTTVSETQNQINSTVNTLNTLNNQIASTQAQLASAQSAEASAKAAVDAKATVITENNRLKGELDNATVAKTNAEAALKNAQTDVDNLNGMVGTSVDVTNSLAIANDALVTAQANYATASATYNTAKAAYDAYQPTYSNVGNLQSAYEAASAKTADLNSKVTALISQRDAAQASYDTLVKTLNTQASAADSTIATLNDTLESSKAGLGVSTLTQQSQINTLSDQIADGKIVSTVSGTVTKVNVKKGDIYTGSTIAVIEGCQEFIVVAQIDEYDIADVSEGMKVYLKTDATRDEELEGRITYVAQSATTSDMTPGATTGSTSAKYKVEIELDKQNERLRLGMNAKISIVTNGKDNVLSVPFDAINTKDDGTKYITILENEETQSTRDIDVTTGIEGTYYVEISSSEELKEGMKVVMPQVDASASINSLIEAMGADAGM